MTILDGRKIRDEILAQIKEEVMNLPFKPIFCDVLVGEDPSSLQYVKMKAKKAEAVGFHFHEANFPISIRTDELVEQIKILNRMPNIYGIIVQLPLPENIDKKVVLDAIDPKLDVDCLGIIASEKFYGGDVSVCPPPAALACLKLLDTLNLDLENKNIIILGNGDLVGRPVSQLLNLRKIKHEIITSRSDNKEEFIKKADIIISGIGKGKFITNDMIKEGVILIDAGTSESNGGIVGDVDFESVKDKVSFISPVPGGVGPVTVAMLLNNVLNVAKNKE